MADKEEWSEVTLADGDIWDYRELPEGSELVGELVRVETEVGPKKSMMYTIRAAEGEVKVWGSTVLNDKLVGVPVGTIVKIVYGGKLKSKTGNEYHTFQVFFKPSTRVDKPEPTNVTEEPPITDEEFLKSIPF